jgi:hypothetical protein
MAESPPRRQLLLHGQTRPRQRVSTVRAARASNLGAVTGASLRSDKQVAMHHTMPADIHTQQAVMCAPSCSLAVCALARARRARRARDIDEDGWGVLSLHQKEPVHEYRRMVK